MRELWFVDPEAETVAVLRRDAAPTLRESAHLVGADQITSPLLPGFSAGVGALFTY